MQPVPLCHQAPGVKEQLDAAYIKDCLLLIFFSGDKGHCTREAAKSHGLSLLSWSKERFEILKINLRFDLQISSSMYTWSKK